MVSSNRHPCRTRFNLVVLLCCTLLRSLNNNVSAATNSQPHELCTRYTQNDNDQVPHAGMFSPLADATAKLNMGDQDQMAIDSVGTTRTGSEQAPETTLHTGSKDTTGANKPAPTAVANEAELFVNNNGPDTMHNLTGKLLGGPIVINFTGIVSFKHSYNKNLKRMDLLSATSLLEPNTGMQECLTLINDEYVAVAEVKKKLFAMRRINAFNSYDGKAADTATNPIHLRPVGGYVAGMSTATAHGRNNVMVLGLNAYCQLDYNEFNKHMLAPFYEAGVAEQDMPQFYPVHDKGNTKFRPMCLLSFAHETAADMYMLGLIYNKRTETMTMFDPPGTFRRDSPEVVSPDMLDAHSILWDCPGIKNTSSNAEAAMLFELLANVAIYQSYTNAPANPALTKLARTLEVATIVKANKPNATVAKVALANFGLVNDLLPFEDSDAEWFTIDLHPGTMKISYPDIWPAYNETTANGPPPKQDARFSFIIEVPIGAPSNAVLDKAKELAGNELYNNVKRTRGLHGSGGLLFCAKTKESFTGVLTKLGTPPQVGNKRRQTNLKPGFVAITYKTAVDSFMRLAAAYPADQSVIGPCYEPNSRVPQFKDWVEAALAALAVDEKYATFVYGYDVEEGIKHHITEKEDAERKLLRFKRIIEDYKVHPTKPLHRLSHSNHCAQLGCPTLTSDSHNHQVSHAINTCRRPKPTPLSATMQTPAKTGATSATGWVNGSLVTRKTAYRYNMSFTACTTYIICADTMHTTCRNTYATLTTTHMIFVPAHRAYREQNKGLTGTTNQSGRMAKVMSYTTRRVVPVGLALLLASTTSMPLLFRYVATLLSIVTATTPHSYLAVCDPFVIWSTLNYTASVFMQLGDALITTAIFSCLIAMATRLCLAQLHVHGRRDGTPRSLAVVLTCMSLCTTQLLAEDKDTIIYYGAMLCFCWPPIMHELLLIIQAIYFKMTLVKTRSLALIRTHIVRRTCSHTHSPQPSHGPNHTCRPLSEADKRTNFRHNYCTALKYTCLIADLTITYGLPTYDITTILCTSALNTPIATLLHTLSITAGIVGGLLTYKSLIPPHNQGSHLALLMHIANKTNTHYALHTHTHLITWNQTIDLADRQATMVNTIRRHAYTILHEQHLHPNCTQRQWRQRHKHRHTITYDNVPRHLVPHTHVHFLDKTNTAQQLGASPSRCTNHATNHDNTTQNIYFERQHLSMCQAHAINHYMGYRYIECMELLEFCKTQQNAEPTLPWSSHYETRTGAFALAAINRYLWHTNCNVNEHSIHGEKLANFAHELASGQPLPLTPTPTTYYVNNGCAIIANIILTHYAHAVALKLVGTTWYLLDSELEGPTAFTNLHHHYDENKQAALMNGYIYALKAQQGSFGALDPLLPQQRQRIHIDLVNPPTQQHVATPATEATPPPPQQQEQMQIDTTIPPPHTTEQNDTDTIMAEPPSNTQDETGPTTTHHAHQQTKPCRKLKPKVAHTKHSRKKKETVNTNKLITQFFKPLSSVVQNITHDTTHETIQDTPPLPAHTPPPLDHQPPPPTPLIQKLRIHTHNVRGLRTHLESAMAEVKESDADIAVLTETKLVSKMRNTNYLLRHNSFSDYHVFCSNVPPQARASGGVLLAIHKNLANKQHLERGHVPPQLHGYLVHVIMYPSAPHPHHLVGIYNPHQADTRTTLYEHAGKILAACASEGSQATLVGDWNAVCFENDRSSHTLTTYDRRHAAFVKQHNLHVASNEAETIRAHTFHQYTNAPNKGQNHHTSRIDDVLTTADNAHLHHTVRIPGDNFDHHVLVADMKAFALNVPTRTLPTSPATTAPQRTSIAYPIPKPTLEAAQLELASTLAPSVQTLTQQLSQAMLMIQTCIKAGAHPPHVDQLKIDLLASMQRQNTSIDNIAAQVQCMLDTALRTLASLSTTLYTAHQRYNHPRNNADRKRFSKALKYQKTVRIALGAIQHPTTATMVQQDQRLMQAPLIASAIETLMTNDRDRITSMQLMLQQQLDTAQRQLRTTINDTRIRARKLEHAKFNTIFQHKRKQAHKRVMNTQSTLTLQSLKDPTTGQSKYDANSINTILSDFFGAEMRAVNGPKTGKYKPQEAERAYPWQNNLNPDPFTLETKITSNETMFKSISDPSLYNTCVNFLSDSKAPGPDGIPNELLKILPIPVHKCMHTLFCIMAATGHTPTNWKHSHTTLLHKKDDPELVKNYRPIGLGNTTYKLWTSMLTAALTQFAESHSIFSTAQEGFRPYKNTARQTQTMLRVIEDAGLTGRNLYTMFIDFSSAFNTTDHDKLLYIMHDLGFPEDAIRVVKDIYNDATTSIITQYGPTAPIPIDRGTIQGDPLSPLLFLIFIEPLLRWLHSGGRGYHFGCLTTTQNDRHNASALAFADDLSITTNSPQDMTTQAKKIELFLLWSGMRINASKCAITGILHKDKTTGLVNSATDEPILKRRLSRIQICGQEIPFLSPDKSYKYLGIWITHTLNWHDQLQHMRNIATKRCTRINDSIASPNQKLLMIKQCVKPALTYSFHTAALTPSDITALDSILVRATKQAFRLPLSSPSAAVLRATQRMGLGLTSLLVDYVQLNAQSLINNLNDSGRLGLVTNALLHLQTQLVSPENVHAQHYKSQLRHYCSLKQLALTNKYNLLITDKGTLYTATPQPLARALSVAAQLHALPQTYIAPRLLTPFTSLGLTLFDLIDKNTKRHLIDTEGLARLVGNKCRLLHRIALNRVTAVMCGHKLNTITAYAGRPLPLDMRNLPTSLIPISAALGPNRGQHHPVGPLCHSTIDKYVQQMHTQTPSAAIHRTVEDTHTNVNTRPQRSQTNKRKERDQAEFDANTRQGHSLFTCDTNRCPSLEWTNEAIAKGVNTVIRHQRMNDTLRTRKRKQHQPARCAHATPPTFPPLPTAPPPAPHEMHTPQQDRHTTTPENTPAEPNPYSTYFYAKFAWEHLLLASDELLHQVRDEPLAKRWQLARQRVIEGHMDWNTANNLYEPCDVVTRITHGPEQRSDPSNPRNRITQYEVAWASYTICTSALALYQSERYSGTATPNKSFGWRASRFLSQITWNDTWDPVEALQRQPHWQQLLTEYNQRREAPLVPPRADMHLNNAQRQGAWNSEQSDPHALTGEDKTTLSRHVHVDTTGTHPDADIPPTGAYTIQIGLRWPQVEEDPTFAAYEPHHVYANQADTAYVYDPNGNLIGCLAVRRLAHLHAQHTALKVATPFAIDVASLLLRHKTTRNNTPHGPTPHSRDCWTPPTHLIDTLRTTLDVTHELSTTPLACSMSHEITTVSYHKDDANFGALYSQRTTAHKWSGNVVLTLPLHNNMAALTAMRWAAACAQCCTDTPTLILILAPHKPKKSEGYLHLAEHLHAIPLGDLTYHNNHDADFWFDTAKPNARRTHPTTIKLIAFANPLGRAHLISRLPHLHDRLSTISSIRHAPGPTPRHSPPTPPLPISNTSRRMTTQNPPLTHNPNAHLQPTDHLDLKRTFPNTYTTVAHPYNGVYTDGSVKTQKPTQMVGAAVYAPPRNMSILVNPRGTGETNTINRAELSGIHCALTKHKEDGLMYEPLIIYTDSSCCMHQIKASITKPSTQRYSKHLHQLTCIRTLLLDRARDGLHTHLIKVPAHRGVMGNEKADIIAKKAGTTPHQCDWQDTSNAQPRTHYYWLAQTSQTNNASDLRFPSNLTTDVKRALTTTCESGHTSPGIYADAWTRAYPTLDLPHSNIQTSGNGITHSQRMQLFRARWGLLWNKKRAAMMRMPYMPGQKCCTNSECPLCEQLDSTTHILGGCNHADMHKQFIFRHDHAVREIADAIYKGDISSSFMIMDAGAAANLPDYVHSKHLPDWLTPPNADRNFRPDLLIIPGLTAARTPPTSKEGLTVHILEIGYCSDIAHDEKINQKSEQHETLAQLLRNMGWTVQYDRMHAISLGYTGTIRTDLSALLTKMGVNATATNELCRNLHDHAVACAIKIIGLRRTLERTHKPP